MFNKSTAFKSSVLALSLLVTGCGLNANDGATRPAHSQGTKPIALHQQSGKPYTSNLSDPVKPAGKSGLGPMVWGMRKFPYPYKAMLAVSPDADHETLRKFNMAHEFLNTTDMTPMGKGLGLDIADSFFMYNGSNIRTYTDIYDTPLSDELTWFHGVTDKPYAASVLDRYIKGGWIDTMHTYGDFSRVNQNQTLFTRQLAEQAITALKQSGDVLTVWTDHGNRSNVDNFGSYAPRSFEDYQQGANPWSKYYHTNLLIPYGVKFVWADRASDVFGRNSMVYPMRLPSGQKVWGFMRYTSSGFKQDGQPIYVWTIDDMPKELTAAHFREIVQHHQYAVIATHLSANNYNWPFLKPTIAAFEALQKQQQEGNILVARTSRLLEYNVVQQYLRYKVTRDPGKTVIDIEGVADPVFGWSVPSLNDLHGITFYTSNASETEIEVAGKPVPADLLQTNQNDGRAPSIGFKWYPADTTNYAVQPAGIR